MNIYTNIKYKVKALKLSIFILILYPKISEIRIILPYMFPIW